MERRQSDDKVLGKSVLDSGKAGDLVKALKKSLSGLDPSQLVKLGMDEPNVNLNLQRLFTEDRKRADVRLSGRLYIGSCGLHIVHGAIQTRL